MITFDGIIFSLRNSLGGIGVYFRELIRHAAMDAQPMQVLLHDPSLTAAGLGCTPDKLQFRKARRLERYRSVDGLPEGIFHSSYYRTAARRNVASVQTVYDFTYEKYGSGAAALAHSLQKRRAIARADAVMCISENTRQDLFEFLPSYPREKVFVTHLAASSQFRPLDAATLESTAAVAQPGIHAPFVLFVSGRSTYKNFAAAVEAVRLAQNVALVCVGAGPFTPAELQLLETSLPGRYSHSGRIDMEGLNRLYNTAVCLLYPSLYEGFGIPPLEAMSAGCPFIALNRSSIPEVAGPAGILLDDPTPELMAAGILKCMDSRERIDLRARGLEQARKFSWENTYAETLRIYRGIGR